MAEVVRTLLEQKVPEQLVAKPFVVREATYSAYTCLPTVNIAEKWDPLSRPASSIWEEIREETVTITRRNNTNFT